MLYVSPFFVGLMDGVFLCILGVGDVIDSAFAPDVSLPVREIF